MNGCFGPDQPTLFLPLDLPMEAMVVALSFCIKSLYILLLLIIKGNLIPKKQGKRKG